MFEEESSEGARKYFPNQRNVYVEYLGKIIKLQIFTRSAMSLVIVIEILVD